MKKENYYNLESRLLAFAVSSIKFLQTLPHAKEYDVIRYQFSKSSTSVDANYKESQTCTYKEFISRIRIALREANESH